MSTPVISAKVAQDLNSAVQRDIDPRLFLCCNYEPTRIYVISEEGKFLTAIQDLYKFALDSSCIIKHYRSFLCTKEARDCFKELREILNQIDLLRSMTDHNQSVQNGRLAKNRLDSYSVWIQRYLGKDMPESQEDFSVLYRQLCKMAESLIKYLEEFVGYLGELPDKEGIVNKWINRTLQWYCNNTKTEIYKGQLMDIYIANTRNRGKDYSELYHSRVLHRKINKWIEAAIFYPIEQRLEVIEEEIQSVQTALCANNPMVQMLRSKITEEEFEALQAKFQNTLEESLRQKEALQKERGELEKEVGEQPEDYFFKGLEKQLRNTMAWLDEQGISYTLLPQDLLQQDIRLFFASVHSPEEDF